jgi:RNA polymerase sigma factor (sigma-70 family)
MKAGFQMIVPRNGAVIICNEKKYSFECLYKEYRQMLLNEACRYIKDRDSCEEIVEDLFVGMYMRPFPLTVKTSVPAYLLVALRNRIFNHIRNEAVYKKHLLFFGSQDITGQSNAEQLLELKELRERVSFFIKQMPARYREVYMLRDQTQFTVKKISAFLNRPIDTVEKQLRKATWFLRDNLKQYRQEVMAGDQK